MIGKQDIHLKEISIGDKVKFRFKNDGHRKFYGHSVYEGKIVKNGGNIYLETILKHMPEPEVEYFWLSEVEDIEII